MKWSIEFPALVFYVKDIKEGFAGKANAFVVRIKETYEDDKGLLAHECKHVGQWFRTFGFHSLLYTFFKGYRYMVEIEAYRKQLSYVESGKKKCAAFKFAEFLTTKYGLRVSKEEAFKDLIK